MLAELFAPEMLSMMGVELLATLYMTLVSTLLAYVLGLPMGLLLVVTDNDGICPHPLFNRILGGIINILRSVPFLILIVVAMPATRAIVGKIIGNTAMIVPLVIAAAPFVARMVESSAKEVDRGVIEASLSMGASPWQIVWRVLVPEALPSLLVGAAIATTTILGYSAMAGILGGGGLGKVAINYGYYRGERGIMWIAVILLVVIVQIFQEIGNWISRKGDKRIR
ncbi:MAG: methionine ABC transporter permease [Oscillospiraceae bacterium]